MFFKGGDRIAVNVKHFVAFLICINGNVKNEIKHFLLKSYMQADKPGLMQWE